jgi:glutathione S-transferase
MSQLILHHYPNSPFAEKIRLILGFKGLHWSSVIIPIIMPKPDVIALTGGYRKTPILQIGADIYCDTALIADVIEARAAHPSLYPSGAEGGSRILAQWADTTLFWTMIPYVMQPAGFEQLFSGVPAETLKAFGEDRAVFRANMPRMRSTEATAALALYLERLEGMLGKQNFLFGSAASIADFSIYHSLWFVSRAGPLARILDDFGALQEWRVRMSGFGHGTSEPQDSAAAINIAHQGKAGASAGISVDTHGIAGGESVVIAATDTGIDPVAGTLYAAARDRISIARQDARAGNVVVHFPRIGFEMRRAK